jgi:putative glutamine amidotransferase
MSRPKVGVTCSVLRPPAYYDRYLRAVEAAGGDPVRLSGLDPEGVAGLVQQFDGLLFPGGWDVDPAEYREAAEHATELVDHELDRMEIALARGAVEAGVPILGICRGQQLVNVALGGSLWQHVEGHDMHGQPRDFLAHPVALDADSEITQAVHARTLMVNSLHHQAVKQAAPGLRVTAQSPDGMIEALESPDRRVVTVQCHPEELVEGHPWARTLFERFVQRLGWRSPVSAGTNS